jgi:ribosomal protein S27E
MRANPAKRQKTEVKKMGKPDQRFKHYPRFLPLVNIHGAYFVDERLHEFRRAENSNRRVVFDSMKGQLMLRKFYVDTCGTCGQEVAILRQRLTSTVKCRVCGAVVPTGDA